jgi:hypothetical protein
MKLTEPQRRNLELLRKHGRVITDDRIGNSAPGFNQTALESLYKLGLVDRETTTIERPYKPSKARRKMYRYYGDEIPTTQTSNVSTYTIRS